LDSHNSKWRERGLSESTAKIRDGIRKIPIKQSLYSVDVFTGKTLRVSRNEGFLYIQLPPIERVSLMRKIKKNSNNLMANN
jgi:hypothetical protein